MAHLIFKRFAPLLALAGLILTPLAAIAHGISDADRQRMLEGGYLQYVGLGATHMITGYDHLLFLFGIVFFLTSFKDIAKLSPRSRSATASRWSSRPFCRSPGTTSWSMP